jgi:hypothetical protein
MRLTDLLDRENAFRFLIGFVLAVVFYIVVAGPATSLAGFYDRLDGLSDSVRRGSFEQAETELDQVNAFYQQSREWGLQWVAEAYLFRDAFLQQASYNYLKGDYETVVNDLADEVDDPRASYLLACAKFQLARQRYRAISDDDPDGMATKAMIIQEVLDDVNADYERALRSDEADRFEYKWNYDLTSNADAVRLALEPLRQAQAPALEQMKGEGTPTRRRRG